MSKRAGIINTFTKGMHRDTIPERQPSGTYTYGLNLVNSSTEHLGILSNEDSNIRFNTGDFDGEVVGVSYFAKIDQSAVFVGNGGTSSLYIMDHNTGEVTKVMTDSDYGCEWGFGGCEMMYGELKLLQPCNDRVIYFSSDCNYWLVNVDEILSARAKCIDSCEHFKLFRCICAPKASLFPVDGGGFIPAGAYWVALQLEDNDGNTTNYFPVSGPVFVGGDDNISGEITNQSIRIFVDAIDEGYEKVNIAIIKRVRGIITVERVVSRSHSNTAFTFDYIGDNADAEQIPIDDILNAGKKYLRGSDLYQKDGVLFLYGIKQEPNVNYQKYANGIQTRMIEFEITAETQKDQNLPTLMRGEVYGIVAWLNYCDGTKSRGFHVPAGAEGTAGGSTVDNQYGSTAGGIPVTLSVSAFSQTQAVLPYLSTFGDWQGDWVQHSGPSVTPDTGPDDGDYHLARATGNIDTEQITTSPSLDLTRSARPQVHFDHYMYGIDVGKIELQVSTNGKDWGTIWERTDNQGTGWMVGTADLTAVGGSWVQLRFRTTAKGNQGDIAVKDIQVTNQVGSLLGGASQQYTDGIYKTSDVYGRTRGNPNENGTGDELEEIINGIIETTGCTEATAKQAIDDYATFYGVSDVCTDDLDKISDIAQNISEEQGELSQDITIPELGKTGSMKEAAQRFYQRAIKNREHIHRGKAVWTIPKSTRYQATIDNEEAKAPRSDRWTTSDGTDLLSEKPRIINIFKPGIYESEIPYPDQCDCEGERMYPEGNIKHHLAPSNCQSTHYISNQVGVPSKQDPVNSPLGDTYIRLLGLEFSNIYIPKEDELPKPLCPNNPITFGILKRDLNDRSVLAKGIMLSTFTGNVRGREHAMGKHGVNSFETVDFAIDNNGSKIGVNTSPNAYLFHSLDTSCQRLPLTVTDVSPQLELFGSGWRYGLYAEGEKPELPFTGKQVDQRGARQAVSLSGQRCLADDDPPEIPVEGITYAPANSVVTPPKGITLPLNNRFRESSVYLQLESKPPSLTKGIGPETDSSFVGDVLDHSAPIETAATWYVALKRELKSQYGSVENQKAISTGIRTLEAEGGSYTSVMGIAGDVFIGMHSIKRSGYVSDKVGDIFPVGNGSSDGRQSEWKRDRSICDHPADADMQNLGVDHYATRLPEDGDVDDAKNWAGLHTTNVTYAASDAAGRTAPDSDYYYPRLQKTLVTYIGEFEVNPWKRATGKGLQKVEGKVYYPALKDLELDSSFSNDIPWPEAWLNRFYVEVEQPSKAQIARKTLIRAMLALIIPAIALLITTQLESIPDTVLTTVIIPMLTYYWMYAKVKVFSDDWLNKIVGIPICKTDSEGGEDYVRVRGLEDNYCKYYMDFSSVNEFDYALGIPSNYNTCDCSECDAKVTKEVYYSNKQVETSIVDSYRNFQAHNYSVIPAHAGPLLKLFVESNRFYGHTTDGMWILQYNNVTAQFEGITTILGRGDLLRDPQQLNQGPTEGYFGLADPNAAISCEAGYVFVSRPSGDIIRIYNGQADIISNKGMYNFFQENISFCGTNCECIDEREGAYYALGYDPRFKRILVTKHDTDSKASWTASYHTPTETWTSFHSYLPKFYIWDQKNMLTLSGNNIWIHNLQGKIRGDARTWCTFYGASHPIMLDFVARQESAEPWQYQHTMLDLDAQEPSQGDWLRGRHIFFDKIGVWNRTQSTGLLPVTNVRTDNPDNENDVPSRLGDRKDAVEVVYAGDQWRINGLTDHIKSCNGAVTRRSNPCNPQIEILDQGEKGPGQQNISDRYLFYRLVLTNSTKVKMYIKSVITAIGITSE